MVHNAYKNLACAVVLQAITDYKRGEFPYLHKWLHTSIIVEYLDLDPDYIWNLVKKPVNWEEYFDDSKHIYPYMTSRW